MCDDSPGAVVVAVVVSEVRLYISAWLVVFAPAIVPVVFRVAAVAPAIVPVVVRVAAAAVVVELGACLTAVALVFSHLQLECSHDAPEGLIYSTRFGANC